MLENIVAAALRQPVFVFLVVLLFTAAGTAAFSTVPIEAFPDVGDVQVTVISLHPGHAPEEVEKQVTIPIEIALAGVPHSVRLFSHTQFGLSYVIVTFDDETTPYFARQQVSERLVGVDLPDGVKPELAPLSTPIGEVYRYRLAGEGKTPAELRELQDWIVARAFRTLPGVADVVSRGGLVKEYDVSIDLKRLKAHGVTIAQVAAALKRGNVNTGGGYVEQGEQQCLVRGIGLLRSKEDIGKVVLAAPGGTPVLVEDVAQVGQSAVPRQGIVGVDDQDDAVLGIVLMRVGENPSIVLDAIHEKVAAIGRMLPKGVRIVPVLDRTWLIRTTLHTVFKNLVEGAALVMTILFLFLGDLAASSIVAGLIPLSLLATFIGLRIKGIPANLLSLGALDFGIIVDGAVIVVENVVKRLSMEPKEIDRGERESAVLQATVEVGRPTLFSMLIVLIAHLPIFALQRHEGRLFAPMAYTVTSALVGSLLFSLTLVPLLCLMALRGHHSGENLLVRFCRAVYRKLLALALARPALTVLLGAAALGWSLQLVPKLGTEFLPELNEGTLWINVMLPPSVSLSESIRLSAEIRRVLKRIPEVVSVVSQAGRPEDGTDPKTLAMAEFFVDLLPQEQWTRKITREALLDEISSALDAFPGLDVSLSQPIRDNILESISQIDGQIVVKIFGQDPLPMRQLAEQAVREISSVPGVARAFVDRPGRMPQLEIAVDRVRASRHGLNTADVLEVIEMALGGSQATEIWEGDRKFGVVVRLPEAQRRDLAAIRRIEIDTPLGNRVDLEQIADIRYSAGAVNVSREGGGRVTAIGVFIKDRDMGGVVADMRERLGRKLELPPGYSVTYGGEFENQERAMKRLLLIVPVSVLLIFVLLFSAFGSVRYAVLILVNVPMGLAGGIAALWVTGIHLSVSAAIGFIALFGQAVMNGVVMVTRVNQLRAGGLPLDEAVTTGAAERMRTVLMTALLAMLGLLPMALSHGIGSEVQRPLAVVVIGGLLSATALTLLVLPALYVLLERRMTN